MKTCPQCSNKVQDWLAACPKCRHVFGQERRGALGAVRGPTPARARAPRTPPAPGESPPRVSVPGTGRSSQGRGQRRDVELLAILSLLTGPICLGIVSVPLGMVALKRIEASGGTLGGRGLAVAGIVLGVTAFVLTVIWPIILKLL